MDFYERSKLSEAFKEEVYAKGDIIIKEGEFGDVFYFVEQGECIVIKNYNGENQSVLR